MAVIFGDNLGNTLNGTAEDDLVHADGGNDLIYGNDGDDNMFGGTGNDTFYGGNGADAFNSGPGYDTMWGEAGIDSFQLQGDGGLAVGGAGADIYFIDTIPTGIYTIDAQGTDATDTLWFGTSPVVQVGWFIGVAPGTGGDNIVSVGGPNLTSHFRILGDVDVRGSDQDDIIAVSNAAGRRYFGGQGEDRFIMDNVTESGSLFFGGSVTFAPNPADIDTLDFSGDVVTNGGGIVYDAGSYTFTRTNGVTGTAYSFLGVVGSDGHDEITGASVGFPGGINAHDFQEHFSGGLGDDSLYGGAHSDTLDGGRGIDLLVGGADAFSDTFIMRDVGDVVVETAGGGTADRVRSTVSYTLASGVEVEFLMAHVAAGTAGLRLTGNGLAQTIIGNAGANQLSDGGGNAGDRLSGRAGNDTYIVLHSQTTVTELAGEGTEDRIRTAVSLTLRAADDIERIEVLDRAGLAAITLVGNSKDQAIIGNAGNNHLWGLGGDDTLLGGAGADRLLGGTGNDRLVGGSAADVFVFQAGFGVDVVADFEVSLAGERIDVSEVVALVDFADLTARHLTEVNGNAVITVGDNRLTLVGVTAAQLSADDFLF